MSLNYMIFWSMLMMLFIGLMRLRSFYQFGIMGFLSATMILLCWLLANQLADGTGLDIVIFNPLANPEIYMSQGPVGWMILMIVPCGWLAPLLGANVAERWGQL